MRTVQIPSTGLQVSAICLGTGDLGGSVNQDESFRLLDIFADHGGNFLDSALIYADWLPVGKGSSERTLGRWMKLRGNRARILVGTKGAHPELSSMHIPRLSPAEILADLEQSLRNLQTDYIDLYWLHRDQPERPVGEILETLEGAAHAGKIRAYGCSNWQAERIRQAQQYAARRGLPGFAADQMLWSMAVVNSEAIQDKTIALMDAGLWEFHASSGMAAIPYTSQANGLFQKMAAGGVVSVSRNPGSLPPMLQRMYAGAENQRRFERAQRLAGERSLTMTQVVLGYLMAQPFPTIPIVGCKRVDHLLDSLKAAEARLTLEEVRHLEGEGVDSG